MKNEATAMKKKDAPAKFGSHPYPPFADNYARFSSVFPGIAVAYYMKKEN